MQPHEPRKRFIEQSDAEWEVTRRTLLAPGPIYWVLLPIGLLAATVRVVIGLVGQEPAVWQDWAALALLIVLWTLFIRAVWQRRVLWQKRGQTTQSTERTERSSSTERKSTARNKSGSKKRRGGKS